MAVPGSPSAGSSTLVTSWTNATVVARSAATSDIVVLDLARSDGADLPAYTAGSHIDVALDPQGIVRPYSLCGPLDGGQYRVAVLRHPNSRGGSKAMHELRPGCDVRISPPRNLFPLASVPRHVLFAGGIGITPILAMARSLDAAGDDYVLHYCARSRDGAAFVAELADNPRVTFHFDDGDSGQLLDVDEAVGDSRSDTAIYVCGPNGFMDHVLNRATAAGWPPTMLRKERFTAAVNQDSATAATGFTVRLARTGAEFHVPEDRSILDVLEEHNVDGPSSCRQGICGECITRVLSGDPDHRDDVLTEDERAEGMFTPCMSRAHSDVIELDL